MKTAERIFELIEKGEMTSILADKVLFGKFRELMKRDLLGVVNDKVGITRKGGEAAQLGPPVVSPAPVGG